MRFGIRDLLNLSAMVAVHFSLLKLGYESLLDAFSMDYRYAIIAFLPYAIYRLLRIDQSRGRGLALIAYSLSMRWTRTWLAFFLVHADLIVANFADTAPLELGTLRQLGIYFAILNGRAASQIIVYRDGIVSRGRFFGWGELHTRLVSRDGSWLVLDSREDDALVNVWLTMPEEHVPTLQTARARAILEQPTLRSSQPDDAGGQESHRK